ncbi:MAG: hypothetical protein O8C66_07605 [Candidatus Methanoperedens sp.]|nr:hypothetical protein [Candidatus Methanoperedens sp.]MCZ7370360.1 hypothetical protein [Candidatus Methanoperedens sp.]
MLDARTTLKVLAWYLYVLEGVKTNFFACGKVTIREVNEIEEGKKLVNSIVAMVDQKQLLGEEWNK